MGTRGPTPQPTNLKVLRGNPGKRPLNTAEPRPRPVAPKCPSWLDSDAKREWRRVAPELERLGLLTLVDMAALAGYCASYSLWKRCTEALDETGMTFETDKGFVGQRPEVSIAARALADVRAFCVQFGLTPSARARMTLPEMPDDDDDSPFDV